LASALVLKEELELDADEFTFVTSDEDVVGCGRDLAQASP
jgi:hypothetical protein